MYIFLYIFSYKISNSKNLKNLLDLFVTFWAVNNFFRFWTWKAMCFVIAVEKDCVRLIFETSNAQILFLLNLYHLLEFIDFSLKLWNNLMLTLCFNLFGCLKLVFSILRMGKTQFNRMNIIKFFTISATNH